LGEGLARIFGRHPGRIDYLTPRSAPEIALLIRSRSEPKSGNHPEEPLINSVIPAGQDAPLAFQLPQPTEIEGIWK